MAKNIGIDPRKARAAMMLAAGVSSIKVAKVLKITVRTLQRWHAEAGFTDLKNDVVSDLTSVAIKTTTESLNQDTKPLFSYQERKKMILGECRHLDKALNAILPRVEEGDLATIATLIKISERRCKLLGHLQVIKYHLGITSDAPIRNQLFQYTAGYFIFWISLGLDQPRNNVTDAITVLAQNGILPENRASSAFEILDEAESKLFQIGVVPDL